MLCLLIWHYQMERDASVTFYHTYSIFHRYKMFPIDLFPIEPSLSP